MSTYLLPTLLQASVNVFTFMCLPVKSAGIQGGSSGVSSDNFIGRASWQKAIRQE
jgi:hypothetical protein